MSYSIRFRDFCRLFLLSFLVLTGNTVLSQGRALVGVVDAKKADIVEELVLSGTLSSLRSSRISPEVNGRVSEIKVDAGDDVVEGETLLLMDQELARLELAQAQAALAEAKAALADAQRQLKDALRLVKDNSIAASVVGTRKTEVQLSKAVLARRKAEKATKAALLQRHTLNAPFTGVVSKRMTDLGEWVGPGVPVLELVAVGQLRLDLQVPQAYFGRIKKNTPVALRLDALSGINQQAHVTQVVPVSDSNARTFLVRVQLDNKAKRMIPGMSAKASLRISTGRTGLAVPRDALTRYPDGRVTIWVTQGNGDTRKVQERLVKTGLSFGNQIEVLSGLQPGVAVVVRGNETLKAGQEVRIDSKN